MLVKAKHFELYFLHASNQASDCRSTLIRTSFMASPSFVVWQVKDETARIKRDTSDALRDEIKKGEWPDFERRIYISLPKTDDHKYHVIGEVCYIILLTCPSLVSLLVRKSHS